MAFRDVIARIPIRSGHFVARKKRKRAELHMDRADSARDRGNWLLAVDEYRKAMELDPSNAGALVQLGHALKESGTVSEAEACYRQAIALEPNNADTFLQLGHARKLQRDLVGALVAYDRAAAIDPTLEAAALEAAALRQEAPSSDQPSLQPYAERMRAPIHAKAKPNPESSALQSKLARALGSDQLGRFSRTAALDAFERAGGPENVLSILRDIKKHSLQSEDGYDLAPILIRIASSLTCPRLSRRFVPPLADLDDGFKALIQEADVARDAADWGTAEYYYWRALALYPKHMGYRIQYAHVIKEAGKYVEAEIQYRTAFSQGETASDIVASIDFTQSKRGGRWAPSAYAYVLEYWASHSKFEPLDVPVTRDAVETVFKLFFDRIPSHDEVARQMADHGSVRQLCQHLFAANDFGPCNRDLILLIAQRGRDLFS